MNNHKSINRSFISLIHINSVISLMRHQYVRDIDRTAEKLYPIIVVCKNFDVTNNRSAAYTPQSQSIDFASAKNLGTPMTDGDVFNASGIILGIIPSVQSKFLLGRYPFDLCFERSRVGDGCPSENHQAAPFTPIFGALGKIGPSLFSDLNII